MRAGSGYRSVQARNSPPWLVSNVVTTTTRTGMRAGSAAMAGGAASSTAVSSRLRYMLAFRDVILMLGFTVGAAGGFVDKTAPVCAARVADAHGVQRRQ